jgi:hypothetical protein
MALINYYDYRKWHRNLMRNLAPILKIQKFNLFMKYIKRKFTNTENLQKVIRKIKISFPEIPIVIKDIKKGEYYRSTSVGFSYILIWSYGEKIISIMFLKN